jgi:hypothetical protein
MATEFVGWKETVFKDKYFLTVWKKWFILIVCRISFVLYKFLGAPMKVLSNSEFFMETDLLILSYAFVQFFSINSQRKENKPPDATFNGTKVMCKIIRLFKEANKLIWFLKRQGIADTSLPISIELIFNSYLVRRSFWEPLHSFLRSLIHPRT